MNSIIETFKCKNCGKKTGKGRSNSTNKYCDQQCQNDFQYKQRVKNFKNGKYIGKVLQAPQHKDKINSSMGWNTHWVRRMLIEEKGEKCNSCGISQWLNASIILHIHHIDGHALNNTLGNLEFLCPNCHSQTPTYGNKGARKSDRRSKSLTHNRKNI